jgi:hypothetical protein
MDWYDTNKKIEIPRPDHYEATTNNIQDWQLFNYGVYPITAIVDPPPGMVATGWTFTRNQAPSTPFVVPAVLDDQGNVVEPERTEMVAGALLNSYTKTCTSWVDPVEEAEKARQAHEESERQRQLNKPIDQKIAENDFLSICDTLTGSTTHAKLGFDQLRAIVNTLPNDQQVYWFVRLQANDSQLQREGGLKWWDDCVWHAEIVQ